VWSNLMANEPKKTTERSTTLRSGRDDKFAEQLAAIWAKWAPLLVLQQLCHFDRSVPGFPASQS
jgi:hypothetical protein